MQMKSVRMKKAAKVPEWRPGGQPELSLKKGQKVFLPFATALHLIKRGKAEETAQG